jgi:hypothetical protein
MRHLGTGHMLPSVFNRSAAIASGQTEKKWHALIEYRSFIALLPA